MPSRMRAVAPAAVVGLVALLVLLAGLTLSLTGEHGTARTALGERTGFSPGAGIVDEDPADLDRDLDQVVESGARWLRLDVDWSRIEAEPGRDSWTDVDRVVAAAQDRHLDVLALLAYTPQWARPAGTDSHAPPADPASFAHFAAASVHHLAPRGVVTYEIWNEPNLPQFWSPTPNAAAYVRLLEPASAAVRATAAQVGTRVTVLTAGLAPASDDFPNGQIDPRTFVERLYALGARRSFDALAVHPYSFPALPSDASTADYNTFQKLGAIRATMVSHGDGGKRVWLTEVGAPTGRARFAVTPNDQAAIVVDAVRAAAALPWTGPLFVYSIRDAGNDLADREDNFGLLRNDFTAKPAWGRLRALLR